MPRFNWQPDPAGCVLIDLETQSAADLNHVGTRRYLRDPTARLMSLAAMLHDDELVETLVIWVPPDRSPGGIDKLDPAELWPEGFGPVACQFIVDTGPELPAVLKGAITAGKTFVAHNAAGFDALAFEKLIGGPQPEWSDTLPLCRAAGLPGSLDDLGQRFLGRGKDEQGAKALKLLWKPKVKSWLLDGAAAVDVCYPKGTLPLWRQILRYNVADVLLLKKIFESVRGCGEPDVLTVHHAINARGIAIDPAFAEQLGEIWAEAEADALTRLYTLTNGKLSASNIRSVPQVRAWVEGQGFTLGTLNRKALERFYEAPEDFFDAGGEEDFDTATFDRVSRVIDVLKIRQSLNRAMRGKLAAVRDTADPDGRVRDMLVYHGAHHGRWTGKGLQPQNIARGVTGLDVEGLCREPLTLDAVKAAAGSASLDDCLATLVRPVFRATPGHRLLIADYAAIEARCIAWLAGQSDLLTQFAAGTDIYLDMASTIFGRPCTKADKDERQIAKICVLGCGYGMSARKFSAFCASQGIDLAEAGVTGEQCVTAYRQKYPNIPAIWRAYQQAAFQAIGRGRSYAGKCDFIQTDAGLVVTLPSGRKLTYRDACIAERVPGWAALLGLSVAARPTVVFTHPRGYEVQLYGGLCAENISSGSCRDLLAGALVRCEPAGLPVVLHVHDEIIAEVPENEAAEKLDTLAAVMTEPPPWARGFPISVEGFDCQRYVKSPWSDSRKVRR